MAIPTGSWVECTAHPTRRSGELAHTLDDSVLFGSDGKPSFSPIDYPVPLPGGPDDVAPEFASQDTVILPVGFEYKEIVKWGEKIGPPGHQITVGNNHDFISLIPIANQVDECFLCFNSEYTSPRPWGMSLKDVRQIVPPRVTVHETDDKKHLRIAGRDLSDTKVVFSDLSDEEQQEVRRLSELILDEAGVNIVHVRRDADGWLRPIADSKQHRRISGYRRENIEDSTTLAMRGPGAGALPVPVGTLANCSGATLPWGHMGTCEENYGFTIVGSRGDWITDEGFSWDSMTSFEAIAFDVKVDVIHYPEHWNGLGSAVASEDGMQLDTRNYGWFCTVDPNNGALIKHIALGRMRHENAAPRFEAGKQAAVYMGNDMSGGGIYKWVSKGVVDDPENAKTAELFDDGTLYVAQFSIENDQGLGCWIPIASDTPVCRPDADLYPTGHITLPDRRRQADGRTGGWVRVGDGDRAHISVDDWVASIEEYTGKDFANVVLGDLVDPTQLHLRCKGAESKEDIVKLIVLMDAWVFGNAVGGTPTARPEDLEVHPQSKQIFVAYTSARGGGDGSPDKHVFPTSYQEPIQQPPVRYGCVDAISEDGDDPASTTFTWQRVAPSGEMCTKGGGFASADNLAFDEHGVVFLVTDISSGLINHEVLRNSDSTPPGSDEFQGIFGHNTLFLAPTRGPRQGMFAPFATGPEGVEMTGPFVSQSNQSFELLLSIQHPGEINGRGQTTVQKRMQIADGKGEIHNQLRTVPVGSCWPHDDTQCPRSAVIQIVRAN